MTDPGLDHDEAHVFIARGDLFQLACDAILVPTDMDGLIEVGWREPLETMFGWDLSNGVLPDGLVDSARRANEGPEVWFIPTGVVDRQNSLEPGTEDWDASLRQLRNILTSFGSRVSESLRTPGYRPVGGRERPLVALPFIGSAAGGFQRQLRRYVNELLGILQETAAAAGSDVLLIIYGGSERADMHEALCRFERRERGLVPTPEQLAGRWERAPSARQNQPESVALTVLFDAAREGRLVPFFGAGVSMSAGSVGWGKLLEELEDSLLSRNEAAAVRTVCPSLDPYDRAQVIANSLGESREEELAAGLDQILNEVRLSLQHVLLAALRPRDAITTNFDDAFERAYAATGRGSVAVMPAADAEVRLLKLHGTLGGSPHFRPVLTREDLIRAEQSAGPLRGALQMLLLTGHVVFIGYSLEDPDLQAAIYEVRRIRQQLDPAKNEPLATALQVVESPALGLVWSPALQVFWPRSPASEPGASPEVPQSPDLNVRSRQLEILLDALADEMALAEVPVLAFHDDHLSEEECQLKSLLTDLRRHFEHRNQPIHVRELLTAYGDHRSAD
jgi:hypothetical protein